MPVAVPAAPLSPENGAIVSIAGVSGPLLVLIAISVIIGILLVINRLPKR